LNDAVVDATQAAIALRHEQSPPGKNARFHGCDKPVTRLRAAGNSDSDDDRQRAERENCQQDSPRHSERVDANEWKRFCGR